MSASSGGRLYSIRGASTKRKVKRTKGSHTRGDTGGKGWFETLHCAWPSPVNGMCYTQHSQRKCSPK